MPNALPVVEPDASPSGLSRRFWLIAALVTVALFAGYWFLLRETYVPVLSNLQPQDAADIVKVLDERKIAYRLGDEGRTVLVPASVSDKARIELVGSELPMRGQVGFELFNQSDMGLTDFAQKVNYQRALQGELVRTILLLDGIQAVRVHLGMPEQSLFRDDRSRPKASVTLILRSGATLTQSRVGGIQRMVAGAVPDMTPDAVAVLDGTGRVVSEDDVAVPALTNDAVIQGYRQQIAAAIRAAQPGLSADVVVSLRYLPIMSQDGETEPLSSDSAPIERAPQPSISVPARGEPDFALNIRVMTRDVLAEEQRAGLVRAIRAAVRFDAGKGDTLAFIAGGSGNAAAPRATSISADKVVAARDQPIAATARSSWSDYWPIAALAIGVLLVAAYLNDRRRARAARRVAIESLAEQLQQRLRAAKGQVA